MKKQKMMSVLALSILGSNLLAPSVLAAENAEVRQYESHGMVQFIPDIDPTDPTDPIDPGEPEKPIDPTNPEGPNPGTPGPLSIDFASSFDFGINKITDKDETYYARAQRFEGLEDRPNYVQVSDKRGTNAGWTLDVKQENQFEATKETKNKELVGAQISLTNAKVRSKTNTTPPLAHENMGLKVGELHRVMTAEKGAGAGTWLNRWDEGENVLTEEEVIVDEKGKKENVNLNKSVTLTVPGATVKDAVNYKTTLTWILSEIPAN